MTLAADESWRATAAAVLEHYPLEVVTLERIAQGLVNLTLKTVTRDGRVFALQRLHPVFGPGVNHNLNLVTAHLAACGLLTPRLLRTRAGALSVGRDGALWRMLTWVEGRAFDVLERPAQAEAAGALLGRFHAALADFGGTLRVERRPIHEFTRHRARLSASHKAARQHRLWHAVTHATAELDALRATHPAPPVCAPRLVHGDPKISNLLFDVRGEHALCLIDLDTLARMALPLELGDALRSWCNPRREDDLQARFDIELFSAALRGYAGAARVFISADEVAAIVPATLEIHLELAARFLLDALDESYFGWDETRYDSRGAHNLARACGQLAAARSFVAQIPAAEDALARAFR